MASYESSRKKRKVSSTDGRASHPNEPSVIASSSALPLPKTTMNDKAANAPCPHEQALKTLNSDLDAMRQLITCKICDRLLYEPYAISCGHTYCYSCLSQWLGSNAKMTCPDCRLVIRQQPTPSYLIRELVLIFVNRNELLPDGETMEEHNKAVREEAEVVAKDKASTDPRTGGMFKGRFNKGRFGLMGPLHDPGDGVDRCPECHWELEDGACNHCGFELDDLDENFSMGESISEGSDDDLDHELGDMDGDDVFVGADGGDYHHWWLGDAPQDAREAPRAGGPRAITHPQRPQLPPRRDLSILSDDESENDEYDYNDTFIDDEDVGEDDGSDAASDVTAGRNPPPALNRRLVNRRPGPVVISDDEDEEDDDEIDRVEIARHHTPSARGRNLRGRPAPIPISDNGDEEGDETAPSTAAGAHEWETDSDDEGPVVRGSQRDKRPNVAVRSRRAVTVSSDDESEESENDGTSEVTVQGGFSPIEEGYGDEASEQTDYDDDLNPEPGYGFDHDGNPVADQFDPYESENASAGGYDEESDDRWATIPSGRRATSNPRLAPSTRLDTQQQRRARHASPQYRSVRVRSPTRGPRTAQSLPQFPAYHHVFPNSYGRPGSSNYVYTLPAPIHPAQPRYQAPFEHPFQLDDTLTSINRNPTSIAGTSNYNQRNQQARTYPYQRNVLAAQPGSSTAGRVAVESNGDVRRKRALSVVSDDSQDFYV